MAMMLSALLQVCCAATQQASSAGSGSFSCTNDVNCSLNGVCGRDGVCRCDPGWGGEQCATLRLAPAAAENGYRQPNRSSWGGSVIKEGETYHMFVEELVNDWCVVSAPSVALSAYPATLRGPAAVASTRTRAT